MVDAIISPVDYYEEIKKERLDIIKAIILKGFTQDNIKKPHYQRKRKYQQNVNQS